MSNPETPAAPAKARASRTTNPSRKRATKAASAPEATAAPPPEPVVEVAAPVVAAVPGPAWDPQATSTFPAIQVDDIRRPPAAPAGPTLWQGITDKFRASPLALVFLVTLAVVWAIAPQKAALALWGVSRIAMGGYLGYWIFRVATKIRPHRLSGIERGNAEKCRAMIIAAAIIAAGLIP